jgi:hypothetical protein
MRLSMATSAARRASRGSRVCCASIMKVAIDAAASPRCWATSAAKI